MLIIPFGLENSEVRRRPWVSIAIMVAIIACFVLLGPPSWGSGWGDRVEDGVRSVEDFLLEHPHLKAAEDIEPFLTEGARQELRRRRESGPAGGSGGGPADLSFVFEGQQQELKNREDALRASLRESPAWRYGFIPARPNVLDAVTSMFLHGGWLHLIGNLVFFFAMGPFLEDVYGRILFTVLYLSSGIVAAWVQAAQSPGSHIPLIGASGAIAGVMGAFLVRLGTARIRFVLLPIIFLPFIRVTFAIRAAIVLPFWFAEQALLATEAPSWYPVAFWAHIGGFVFGLAAAAVIKLTRLEERWVDPAIGKQISWSQNPALVRASEARFAGDIAKAERELATVLPQQPENIDALRLAFDLALESQRVAEAVRCADRLLSLYVRRGETQLARSLVFDVMRKARDRITPRFGLAAARFLEKEGEIHEALELNEQVISLFPADASALQALVRIATMRRQTGDEAGFARTLQRARRHPLFSAEWEAALQQPGRPPARG